MNLALFCSLNSSVKGEKRFDLTSKFQGFGAAIQEKVTFACAEYSEDSWNKEFLLTIQFGHSHYPANNTVAYVQYKVNSTFSGVELTLVDYLKFTETYVKVHMSRLLVQHLQAEIS